MAFAALPKLIAAKSMILRAVYQAVPSLPWGSEAAAADAAAMTIGP